MHPDQKFVPALGISSLTGRYDRVVAVMSRERHWRSALLNLMAPSDEDSIVDFGAGTGTLCIGLKRRAPDCRLVGVDPDPKVLVIARAKAEASGIAIQISGPTSSPKAFSRGAQHRGNAKAERLMDVGRGHRARLS